MIQLETFLCGILVGIFLSTCNFLYFIGRLMGKVGPKENGQIKPSKPWPRQ